MNNGNCSQICTSTAGSLTCSCVQGYFLSVDNSTCAGMDEIFVALCRHPFPPLDVNECSNNNGNCSQICVNTIGSYYCSCNNGYALNSDDGIGCFGMNAVCLN